MKRTLYSTAGRLSRLFENISNVLTAAAVIGLAIGLPTTMTVAGFMFRDRCPVEPRIPQYLYIGGITTLVLIPMSAITGLFANVKERGKKTSRLSGCLVCINGFVLAILSFFAFAWFIMGNIWVFKSWLPDYHDSKSPRYCDKTVYTTAIGIICFTYLFTILTCIISFCCRRHDEAEYKKLNEDEKLDDNEWRIYCVKSW